MSLNDARTFHFLPVRPQHMRNSWILPLYFDIFGDYDVIMAAILDFGHNGNRDVIAGYVNELNGPENLVNICFP